MYEPYDPLVTSSEVKFGDWIPEGLRMFAAEWKVWVLQALVSLMVQGVPVVAGMIGYFVALISWQRSLLRVDSGYPQDLGHPPDLTIFVVWYAIILLCALIAMVIGSALVGGLHHTAFKQLRGEKISVSDLFSGLEFFPRVLGANLVISVLALIGLALCIVPMFLVMGWFFFTIPLIVHARMGVFEAMRASKRVTERNLLMFILFGIVVGLIAQIGSYACYVGLLASYPLMFTITTMAYRDCFGVRGARSFAANAAAPPAQYAATPPPSVVQPDGSPCGNCGALAPQGAAFCPGCGGAMNR